MKSQAIQFKSHVSLSESTRETLVARLNLHLANTVDLHSQIKQAHWTIKGPQFFARHQLFDQVAEHLEQQADAVAERIATLGGYPRGTARMAAATSALSPFDTGHVSGAHLIRDLIAQLGRHAASMRTMLAEVETEDVVSADLLTGQLRTVELDLWFFESHFNE